MSQLNSINKSNVIAIVLCAGEGIRFGKLTKKIPKPLIKIDSLNNISILYNLIKSLEILNVKKIGIITGHLNEKIEKNIQNIIKTHQNLQDKVIINYSGDEYKKGPLFSLFSIKKNRSIYRKNTIIAVYPGDTIFEFKLLRDISNYILSNYHLLLKIVGLFYQNIKVKNLPNFYRGEQNIVSRHVSIIETKNSIRQINKIDVKIASKNKYIKRVIPVVILNKSILETLIELSKDNPAREIREILNIYLKQKNEILTFRIKSTRKFYDIDTINDLNYFNSLKKKGGQ